MYKDHIEFCILQEWWLLRVRELWFLIFAIGDILDCWSDPLCGRDTSSSPLVSSRGPILMLLDESDLHHAVCFSLCVLQWTSRNCQNGSRVRFRNRVYAIVWVRKHSQFDSGTWNPPTMIHSLAFGVISSGS